MTPAQVTRWVHSQFRGMHRTRLVTLSAMIVGFLRAARLGVAAIARGIVGKALVRHRIKRVDRFLGNRGFDVSFLMERLTWLAVERMRRVVVALDWVELRNGYRALVAAACTGRGRSLPVAWTVVHSRRFYRSQNSIEEGLLRLLASFLPPAVRFRLTVVADRGFGRASFISALESLGFSYVIRVRGRVEVSGKEYKGLLEDYALEERDEVDLGWVEYRHDGAARTRVVMAWLRGHDEPLYLVTNLKRSPGKVVLAYRERMQEEESFRDLKSHRYGFALRYVKLSAAGRYLRLLAIWAIGMWLYFIQGLAAVKKGLDRGLSAASNRRRELSLVRIGVMLLECAPGPPAALLALLSRNPHLKRWG